MAQLKNRNSQIPFGLKFYDTPLRFEAPSGASFEVIVQAVIAARKGNPAIAQASRLSTDYTEVCNEVDRFNVAICERMGWKDYYVEGGAVQLPPFPSTPPQPLLQRLKEVAAGGVSLVDWIRDGAEAVAPELSAKRAATCVDCPKHGKGDWLSYFTQPVSTAIKKAIETRNEWNLSTPYDSELKVCTACDCPTPLLVHVPLAVKLAKMPPAVKASLPDTCWIKREELGK